MTYETGERGTAWNDRLVHVTFDPNLPFDAGADDHRGGAVWLVRRGFRLWP
jgi:hypothetical protein